MKARYGTLGFAIASLGAACAPSLEATFVDSAYPKDVAPIPKRDVLLGVDAAVLPTVVVSYDRPREVAACLSALASDTASVRALGGYAFCLADGAALSSCVGSLPFVAASAGGDDAGAASHALSFGCASPPGTARDSLRLALALSEAAETMVGHYRAAAGGSAGNQLPPELEAAFAETLKHASRVVAATPVAPADPAEPALALSGGAANGAFVSGYVYGLLWLRERAHLYATPEQTAALDGYRFGSVFSSSVGSLVGLALDLYYASGEPSAQQIEALDQCIAEGGGPVTARPERRWQDCALGRLQSDFVKNEWDLLCAQKGSALDLMSDDFDGVLRFDPMERTIVAPLLEDFEDAVTRNGFLRTTLTTELEQHVVVGVDERACLGQGMPTRVCLVEGLMSSLVEPIFVPPRPRIYSGLRGPEGEAGHWLDGSLHSMNPTARAAAYTLGKVLSVNTLRADGVPLPPLAGAMPLALESMNEMAASQRDWELAYAELQREHRQRRACAFGALVGSDALCPGGRDGPAAPAISGDVLSVYVPGDIEPARFVATGYTFDPLVMRGLFLWGKQELFRTRTRVLSHLGWCGLEAMVDGAAPCAIQGVSAALAKDLALHEQAVRDELAVLAQYADDDAWKKHTRERRDQLSRKLTTCR